MKRIKTLLIISLSVFFLFSISSCAVVKVSEKDKGRHLGWFKNKKNPHNPNTTKIDKNKVHPKDKKNKGKSKGKVKKK